MQRIRVDLPEPDGPQITMRSPRRNVRSTSRSTWNSPNHLLSPLISTATSRLTLWGPTPASTASMAAITCPLSASLAAPEPALDAKRVARHRVAAGEIDQRRERVAARARHRRRPGRILARGLDRLEEVEDADEEDEGGVLEQAHIVVEDVRDGDAQRRRQHDEAQRLPVAEPERARRFPLPLRDRLQAGAHHLGHVGGGEQRDADEGADELVGRPG